MTCLKVTYIKDQINVKMSQWDLSIADTATNRKILLVFLRSLKDSVNNKHIFTFQKIADEFGYADRRNVNNYWRDFEKSDLDILRLITRKRKVDNTVVKAVESELKGNIQASLSELCSQVNKQLKRCDLRPTNIRAALEQIPCTVIRREVISKWDSGTFHPKEKVILEEAMRALQEDSSPKKKQVLKLLSGSNIEASEPEETKIVQNNQWEAVDKLLDVNSSADEIPESIQQMVIALSLYYWNVPLSRIGIWFGKSKSTVWIWVTGLSVALWSIVKEQISLRIKSSAVYVDEKWIKVKGCWHYWHVAVDVDTGLPVMDHLLSRQGKWACRWFFLKMKLAGIIPNIIMTDGLISYPGAINFVFTKAKHLLCIFHHQQGIRMWIKKNLTNLEISDQYYIEQKMKKIVQTSDSRTTLRRLESLEKDNNEKKWGIDAWLKKTKKNLGSLLLAIRNNKYPRTNNEVERFFRQFQRFYKTRNGFHSVNSAKQQLMLFMVTYFFTIQPKTGKAPIEKIMPEARLMPFYQILNDPITWISNNQSVHLSRKLEEEEKMAEFEFKEAS